MKAIRSNFLLNSSGLKFFIYLSRRFSFILRFIYLHWLKYPLSFLTLFVNILFVAWIFLWSLIFDYSKIGRFYLKTVFTMLNTLSRETIFYLTLRSLLFFLHLKKHVFKSVNLHLTIFLTALCFLFKPYLEFLFSVAWIYFKRSSMSWFNFDSKRVAIDFLFLACW